MGLLVARARDPGLTFGIMAPGPASRGCLRACINNKVINRVKHVFLRGLVPIIAFMRASNPDLGPPDLVIKL